MMLINFAPTEILPPDELEVIATPAQLDRIARYQEATYYPIAFKRGNAGRLILTLERCTSHPDGRIWKGQIKLTINPDGNVDSSVVLPCQVSK